MTELTLNQVLNQLGYCTQPSTKCPKSYSKDGSKTRPF
jgi:hypothetical protein